MVLEKIVAELRAERARWRAARDRVSDFGDREFPSRESVRSIFLHLRGALFPLRLGPADLRRDDEDLYVGQALDSALQALIGQVRLELALRKRRQHRPTEDTAIEDAARALVADFASRLPSLRRQLDTDVEAAYRGDPAAQSVDEVLLCYPGNSGLDPSPPRASFVYARHTPLIARIGAELRTRKPASTSIRVRPSARIFLSTHGTGVVIGETAEIGERVRIYQAVTLGAKQFETEADGSLKKRPAAASDRRRRRGDLCGRDDSRPNCYRQRVGDRRQCLADARCAARLASVTGALHAGGSSSAR